MTDEKAPSAGGFLASMPMHFCSGVDSATMNADHLPDDTSIRPLGDRYVFLRQRCCQPVSVPPWTGSSGRLPIMVC
jgi:hypothetical protein